MNTMNKQYHTIEDLWIQNDTELLETGKKVHWSVANFELRLNKEVPITHFAEPKNMLLQKWICRRNLQNMINLLIKISEKINQTQWTGRKELLEILKKMDR